MKSVEIVTIKNKLPLWKKDEPATNIELIQLEETGFEIVSQKDLYEIGDKAIYIQPDYCLSEISLFESFLKPNGDASKCKLGSKNRIKAIKFNFHRGDGNVIYSQGILLPFAEISQYLKISKQIKSELQIYEIELDKALQITKWEEPDDKSGSGVRGGASCAFPEGMYRTDEENINNLFDHIFHKIGYPVKLIGTEKIDGSSITLFYKDGKSGICSRNLQKPLVIKKVVGRKNPWFGTRIMETLYWLRLIAKPDYNIYEEKESDSDFVRIGKPYLDKFTEYCKKTNQNLCLRGELNGEGLKGSGNKNNPSTKQKPNIKFFGLDKFEFQTIKLPESDFDKVITDLGFDRCKVVFNQEFTSKEHIMEVCNNYFKDNMIEGIVLRTEFSDFSTKVMNLEYDSKK